MDPFDLSDEQVRAILDTPEGVRALWDSEREPAVVVRCPERHALARVYSVADTAYLVIGQTTMLKDSLTGLHGRPRHPRSWDLGRPGLTDDDWDEVRCHCRGWITPLGYIYDAWKQGEREFILDSDYAYVPGDQLWAAHRDLRSRVERARTAWADSVADVGPRAAQFKGGAEYEELGHLLVQLEGGPTSRAELEKINSRMQAIWSVYLDMGLDLGVWIED